MLLEGGKLIAVHKGRYYQRGDGLALGPGPFITGLEFASGQEAVVVGKPQRSFYEAVLKNMDCEAADTIMIGDVSDGRGMWLLVRLQAVCTSYWKKLFQLLRKG